MIIIDGFIIAIEKTDVGFIDLLDKIRHAPEAPFGYQYKLRADNLEWELVEVPPDPEPTPTEDEALTRYANELTGDSAENIQEATENLIKIVKEDK